MISSSKEKQIKVCLVAISLSGGGAERSTALLSKMLSNQGFDVHLALIKNSIDYEYQAKLYLIGNSKKERSFYNKAIGLLKFRNYLKTNQFDFIIDNRTRPVALKESIYSGYVYRNFKVIFVVRSYHLENYFPNQKWMASKLVKKAHHFIGVSKAISERINKQYHTNKASYIYNPASIKEFEKLSLEKVEKIESLNKPYIISMGRLDEYVKNFSLLIEAYKKSKLPENNILLKIIGKGADKALIEDKIKQLDLEEYVEIVPFANNPFPWLKNALFTVLTSKYEGFPRMLIESLAVKTPVVSVDCKSGPSEIVQHKKNGLLIENNNINALADAMNSFIFNLDLYKTCKENAQHSISHLKINKIAKQWKELLTKN
ncbi:MAG: glycosyltransferase [Flavobacteriaceae bacterium]|nr:glycosyltransferase [Flavobacteriaceae bacterium]